MNQPREYAQLLRAIGQALEVLNFGDFEMAVAGRDVVVRGTAVASTEQAKAQAIREKVRKFVWEALPGAAASEAEIEFAMSTWPTQLDLRYTTKDLNRLEQDGKAKRRTTAGVPDVAGLSQLLRTIGAYVEQKRGRLVKISRYGEALVIEYDTASGDTTEEMVTAGSLYDLWVELYLQRSRGFSK